MGKRSDMTEINVPQPSSYVAYMFKASTVKGYVYVAYKAPYEYVFVIPTFDKSTSEAQKQLDVLVKRMMAAKIIE
jgi:hypothetical protein